MGIRISIFVLLLLTLLPKLKLSAQNVLYHGGSEEDIANSVFQYKNHYYVTGTTRISDKSSTDYYVLQLNENGSINDEYIFGFEHGDYGKDIIVNNDGIFVFGKSWDGGFWNNDMTMIKLNLFGNVEWVKYYGDFHNDLGHKFIQTNDGGFVMVGFNRSVDDFGDAYIVKADKDGELIWENHFGNEYVDHAFSVVENARGEFIIAGTLGGFYNPTSTDFLNHDADILVIKTDANGEKIWLKTFGGESHDWAKDIILSADGGYYVCGSTQNNESGSFDIFLMKIDDNGDKIWIKTFGGSDWEYGETVQMSSDRKLFVLGTSASFSNNYKPDHFLIKTDLEGETIWTKTFGVENSDYSSDLICTPDSGCVFTGWATIDTSRKKDIVFYKISKDGKPETLSYMSPSNDSINQIQIFPNPVITDSFSLIIDTALDEDFKLSVFNLNGEIVFDDIVKPNIMNSYRMKVPQGIYIVSVLHKNKIVFKGKLVFQ